MMTPLQALETIKKALNIEWGNDTCENDLKPEIDLLTSLITPPTVDEVCKALSEYFGRNVYYESVYFLYRKEEIYNQPFIIAHKHKSGLVELTKNVLPPHLIVMIGRFYEGLEV